VDCRFKLYRSAAGGRRGKGREGETEREEKEYAERAFDRPLVMFPVGNRRCHRRETHRSRRRGKEKERVFEGEKKRRKNRVGHGRLALLLW